MPPSALCIQPQEAALLRALGQGTVPAQAFPHERGQGGAPPCVETPQASTAVGEPRSPVCGLPGDLQISLAPYFLPGEQHVGLWVVTQWR
jgi:hypothetical protein